MGTLGLWGGVLRAILGWRRGTHGRFCRGIPGFLGEVRVRQGDSAHGGQRRGGRGEKIFKKGVENLKIGVREGSEGGAGALYIGCAR